jgi:rhodanese-related sulfurtransferase
VSTIPEIDLDTLDSLLDTGVVLIDVREDDEYADGHVEGAQFMPLATVPDRVDEFPTDAPVYVICALGGRSGKAVEFLRNSGVDAVNIAGGTNGWIESGRSVVRGSSPV